jgi:hypothetical protein
MCAVDVLKLYLCPLGLLLSLYDMPRAPRILNRLHLAGAHKNRESMGLRDRADPCFPATTPASHTNCSTSVEPARAVVEERPLEITCATSSK